MTLVPDGWAQHTPHQIAGPEKGALVIGPFGSNLKTSDYRDEGVPLVFVKDIRAENFSRPRAYVSIAKAAELVAHEVQPGDILITKMGEPPGDVALYDSGVPGIITADCIRLRPASGFDRRFLLHALRAPDVRRQVNEITTGAAQQKVSLDRFRTRVHISAPPLSGQQRIAAALDQVDTLRAKRREAIVLLDDLAQSIFLEMFGDPFRNPKKFPVCELSSLVADGDRINYGVVQPGGHVDGGISLIRSGDLGRYGVDRSNLMSISLEVEKSYARSRIQGNEILIGCVGAIGSISVVTREDIGSNVARAVARVPISDGVDREYIASYLRMDFVQKYFERELRTVAQPTLNIKQIKEAPVVFPPQELRSRFVERTNQIARGRAAYKAHLATLDELFESLQQRAFAGQLWDHEVS